MARRWFERKFAAVAPDLLAPVVERLRGTPGRLEERVRSARPAQRILRPADGSWSIQENVGHLVDLEPLWSGRLDDFQAGIATLRPADLENRATHEADHNRADLEDLLRAFRTRRAELVRRIEAMDERDRQRVARHPRLDQPMRVADLAFFVAEHDDHHLARITALANGADGGAG